MQGYGNALSNAIYGTGADNLLDGDSGVDAMYGLAGNDSYFVDNAGDFVIENLNEGSDLVYSAVSYTLAANTENLVLLGSGDLNGTGNTLSNAIYGNTGANTLNGGAAADFLQGNAGNDTFVFNAGQANGDMVADFAGNAGAAGTCCSSSATARARPSPTSTLPIGRSTTPAAPRMMSLRSATPRRSM